jgi:hypothetical protein
VSEEVVIEPRFRGPPESANGGYTCGLVARFVEGPATVTLRSPPPLSRRLRIEPAGDEVLLLDDDTVVAQARAGHVDMRLPDPVSFEEAQLASSRYPWREGHPYPTCFVCGPRREPGDGLRIFPGPVEGRTMYASPWIPERSLANDDGSVGDEFVWGALDWPSGIVTDLFGEVGLILLGRLTVDIRRPPTAGSRYVVQAWPTDRDGRKLNTASALFSDEGELYASARAVWIELRPASEADS